MWFSIATSSQQPIDLLAEIPEDHPQLGLPAIGQSADWNFQLQRYDEAERLYVKVLQRAPHAAQDRRPLAYLLNRQGRVQEATEHVHELCRQGNVRQDELHSLILLIDAMYDDSSQSERSICVLSGSVSTEDRFRPASPYCRFSG